MPYRDAFDFKPPGIFVVYAFARLFAGSAEWGIRVLEVAGLFAMVGAMVNLCDRLWQQRTAGWLAGALAALVHAQLEFWHTAQPETFGGMLSILGIWLSCTAPTSEPSRGRSSPLRLLGTGMAFGMAGLLKPPLAGGGAVVGLWLAATSYLSGRDLRRAVRPPLWIFVGGALPFVLCLTWFAARGALTELHETLFVFTPYYTKLGWRGRTAQGLLYQAFAEWLVAYASVMAVGLALGLANWRRAWRRPGVPMILGVIGIQLVGVALQGKFFPYHYAAVWPLTALLAGLGWNELWTEAQSRGRLALGGLALLMVASASLRTATKDVSDSFWTRAVRRVVLLARGWSDDEAIDGLATVADVNAGSNRKVARFLREHVTSTGSAYVWGFEPVIYDLASVRAASRFIYNVPQRVAWASTASRGELMCELAATRPDVIVVASGDVFPVVTDNAWGSEHVLREDFGQLRDLLAAGYRKHSRIDDFDLYLRADADP